MNTGRDDRASWIPNNTRSIARSKRSAAGIESQQTRPAQSPRAELASRLARLAEHLPEAERHLVQSVYAQGLRVESVAALSGVNANQLRRRLAGLRRRMLAPEFAFVALAREQWPSDQARVAASCVLGGRSMRAASRELGMSMHSIRLLRERVLAMCRGAQATRAMLDRQAPGVDRAWRDAQAG